jgi:hypothetical protein
MSTPSLYAGAWDDTEAREEDRMGACARMMSELSCVRLIARGGEIVPGTCSYVVSNSRLDSW